MKKMILILGMALLGVGGNAFAQGIRYMATGPVQPVDEVGVIFAEKENGLIADLIFPEHALPKGYKPQGIEKNDVLVMVNGVSVKTANELKAAYDKVKVGDTIKLGLKRGDEKMIASFVKIDPEHLPKRKMIKRTPEGKEIEETK